MKIQITETDKELFKGSFDRHNFETIKIVFEEINQFCKTKRAFEDILEDLTNVRYKIDDLKYLHEIKDRVNGNVKGHYSNPYIDNFLLWDVADYDYKLEELENSFSDIYQKS